MSAQKATARGRLSSSLHAPIPHRAILYPALSASPFPPLSSVNLPFLRSSVFILVAPSPPSSSVSSVSSVVVLAVSSRRTGPPVAILCHTRGDTADPARMHAAPRSGWMAMLTTVPQSRDPRAPSAANERWARRRDTAIAVLGWLIIVALVVWAASHVIRALLILIVAALLAYALMPAVKFLSRFLPRPLALLVVYLAFVSVIGALGYLVIIT